MQNISSSLFQNRRALIADPDVPFVRSLKTFLEALGFEVRSAGSAEEAERMALESPPDLLITEILLEHPDSGFILAHRLRRRVSAVRIVIVSNVSCISISPIRNPAPGLKPTGSLIRTSVLSSWNLY